MYIIKSADSHAYDNQTWSYKARTNGALSMFRVPCHRSIGTDIHHVYICAYINIYEYKYRYVYISTKAKLGEDMIIIFKVLYAVSSYKL